MATEADLIQKFKDLDIPVGADFEELIHAAFAGSNLADLVNSYDSRIATVETDLATKADDSKVVHDNKNGTEQLNGAQVQPFNKLSDTIGGRNLLPVSNYNSGYVNGADGTISHADGIAKEVISNFIPVDITQSYYCQIIQQVNNNQAWWGIGFYDANKQFISRPSTGNTIVTGTITSVIRMLPLGFPNISIPNVSTVVFPANTAYVRVSFRTYGNPIQASLEKSSVLSDWTPAPEDKADDSKVAHLSGANNFDTIPTVNNNPLLLASSLPSDLARTSQQTNFTAGLQSNGTAVATQTDVTTAVNTATENMADTTKATNFTAGLKSGGVNVATAADLKSLEDASWHEVSLPDSTILKNAHFMYRSELIDAHYNIPFILTGTVFMPNVKSSDGVILLDLSSYLPIPKDDYKNYTVNSAILGPSDKSFIESDNAGFDPNYYLGEEYLRIKFVNSDLVLYSTSGYA